MRHRLRRLLYALFPLLVFACAVSCATIRERLRDARTTQVLEVADEAMTTWLEAEARDASQDRLDELNEIADHWEIALSGAELARELALEDPTDPVARQKWIEARDYLLGVLREKVFR